MIEDGMILIDSDGAEVGQVNDLSVYDLGDHTFGKPSRITCKTFLGRGGVINIERESQMSGRIHDKGVLILGGYLGWKFAQNYPESLFIFAMMMAFFYAMLAELTGLSAIVGAFIAGVSFVEVRLVHGRDIKEGAEYLQIIFAAIFLSLSEYLLISKQLPSRSSSFWWYSPL
jgi:hypothetical protein